MIRFTRRLAFAVVLLLCSAVALATGANASRSLSLSPGGNITATSQGLIGFRAIVSGLPVSILCNVELTGSLSRSFPKVSGTLLGKIHSARMTSCSSSLGRVTGEMGLTGSGWKLRYSTFTGTLPTANGIVFAIDSFSWLWQFDLFASGCLFQGTLPATLGFAGRFPNTSGLVTTPRNIFLLRTALGPTCPAAAEMFGPFSLTPVQTLVVLN